VGGGPPFITFAPNPKRSWINAHPCVAELVHPAFGLPKDRCPVIGDDLVGQLPGAACLPEVIEIELIVRQAGDHIEEVWTVGAVVARPGI
jgi:hypothetical protein